MNDATSDGSTVNRAPRRRVRYSIIGGVLALPLLAFGIDAASAAPTPPPVGSPPVAVITLPSKVFAGIPVTLSGADSSTPTGGISEWEWDLDDTGRYERDSTSTPWVSEAFERGRRTVRLRVRNTAGLVATATKSFTVVRPPLVDREPGPPTAVEATVEGTTINVTWKEPADAATATPTTYRVSTRADEDGDPIYVPADGPLEASFEGLVPGDYSIRVAAVNRLGTGPSTGTDAAIIAKGARPSVNATASASPDATGGSTPAAPTSATDPAASPAAASGGDSGDNRDLFGYGLITAGAVVLVGAGVTAGVTAWRRRDTTA